MIQRTLKTKPNNSAAGKAALASRFAVEYHWRGLPEPNRWG